MTSKVCFSCGKVLPSKKRRYCSADCYVGYHRYINEGHCFGWSGRQTNGYPCVRDVNYRDVRVHRFIYEKSYGKIPDGMVVRHICDNPSCTNLEHLLIGTQRENMLDMSRRERMNLGEKMWTAKLTEKDVREIRHLYASGLHTQTQIGEMFGVNGGNISRLLAGKIWKHVI